MQTAFTLLMQSGRLKENQGVVASTTASIVGFIGDEK